MKKLMSKRIELVTYSILLSWYTKLQCNQGNASLLIGCQLANERVDNHDQEQQHDARMDA